MKIYVCVNIILIISYEQLGSTRHKFIKRIYFG